jgi:hypothetical protein
MQSRDEGCTKVLPTRNGGKIMNAHRRHDISDKVWGLLEPHLPGKEGMWGGIATDCLVF